MRQRSIDTSVFWISLYSTPTFWGVFFFLEVIGFKWMWVIHLFTIVYCVIDFFNIKWIEYDWIL